MLEFDTQFSSLDLQKNLIFILGYPRTFTPCPELEGTLFSLLPKSLSIYKTDRWYLLEFESIPADAWNSHQSAVLLMKPSRFESGSINDLGCI